MTGRTIAATAKLVDILIIILAAYIAYSFRFNLRLPTAAYLLPIILVSLFSSLSLSIFGRYDTRNSSFGISHLKEIAFAFIVSSLLASMVFYLTKSGASFSRVWFVQTMVLSFAGVSFFRYLLTILIDWGIEKKNILIVGNNATAQSTFEELTQLRESTKYVRRVTYKPTKSNHSFSDIKNDILASQDKNNSLVSEIWFSHDVYSMFNTEDIEDEFSNTPANLVFIAEKPLGSKFSSHDFENVGDIITIGSNLSQRERINAIIKSCFDFLFALVLLILTAPLLALIAIAIKATSKGPIIYQQPRHGLRGKKFNILKFRTMQKHCSHEGFSQAIKHDPRVTKLGKLLRMSSLDELPQLINVLKGEMSLVGPRPHSDTMNEHYRKKLQGYMKRHSVKPGITGLAQIRGFRGNTSNELDMVNRINSDLEYIRNYSLSLDASIILRTFWSILVARNAY